MKTRKEALWNGDVMMILMNIITIAYEIPTVVPALSKTILIITVKPALVCPSTKDDTEAQKD